MSLALVSLLIAALGLPGRALPQDAPALQPPGADTASPGPPRTVMGRVVRPVVGGRPPRPVSGVQVVLHRIGTDGAGPLDSLRTDRDGRYRFRYRRTGSDDAMYIVSAEHDGIAYFASALRDEDVSGDDAEIVVFDTTSAPLPIQVNARHVVVSSALEGERQVLEIYELANDTLLTLVPGERERAVWTAVVPPSAHDFAVPADLGIAQSSLRLVDGRVLLFAPFTPGIRQIAFSYRIPVDSFPLRLPLERPTRSLEVMLEEPTASASAPGLAAAESVSVDSRSFRRFMGSELPASAVLTIDAPVPPAESRVLPVALTVTAIGVVMLVVLARSFARRSPGTPRTAAGQRLSSVVLAQRLAALDAAFARLPSPTDEARDAYQAQRAAIAAEHDAALAREHGHR